MTPRKTHVKPQEVKLEAFLHNGEGHPELQFPDPITGQKIGGQVAAMRMSMRYRHVVMPWARRQGKTKYRQFYFPNRATITPGEYYAGICFPDHTTAAKVADNFRKSWGGMVKASKINDKDQDRWIELHPFAPPDGPPPAWFTDYMADLWLRCQDGDYNTSCKIYFWGAAHPHYQKIQGFPHPFHDIHWDETQQIHPYAYRIVRPMLRDVRGHEVFTGTPDYESIGNAKFQQWWDVAADTIDWFRMRIPDGSNPHVPPEDPDEVLKTMSLSEIRQTMYAEFLSGEGAIFKNIESVIVLPYLKEDDERVAWVRELRARFTMSSTRWWIHEPEPIEGHIYGASIDWARSPHGDYSVLTVFDFSTGKQVALFRWRGEDFTAQMEMVLAVQKHYDAQQLHSDSNGMGEAMADFLRRRHALGFVGHKFGKNKAQYVRRSEILFEDGDVRLIKCAEQQKEFQIFMAHESEGLSSEKKITYGAPVGENDDFVAAFMQLSGVLTIVGRQTAPEPEAQEPPMFDEEGETTMELFAEGLPTPFDGKEAGAEKSWDSVVLPPNYR